MLARHASTAAGAADHPPHHQQLVRGATSSAHAVAVEIDHRRRRQPALVPAIGERVGQDRRGDVGGAGGGRRARRGRQGQRIVVAATAIATAGGGDEREPRSWIGST
jgi:hypothetical protein